MSTMKVRDWCEVVHIIWSEISLSQSRVGRYVEVFLEEQFNTERYFLTHAERLKFGNCWSNWGEGVFVDERKVRSV